MWFASCCPHHNLSCFLLLVSGRWVRVMVSLSLSLSLVCWSSLDCWYSGVLLGTLIRSTRFHLSSILPLSVRYDLSSSLRIIIAFSHTLLLNVTGRIRTVSPRINASMSFAALSSQVSSSYTPNSPILS